MKIYTILFFSIISVSTIAQEQFTLYFDFDIDRANDSSSKRLSNWISQNSKVEITKIYGYADSIGDAGYNTGLSLRRARYVQDKLKVANPEMLSGKVEVKGFGETRSFSANRSSDRIVIIHYNDLEPPASPVKEVTKMPPPASPTKTSAPKLSTEVTKAVKGDKVILHGVNFYNNSDMPLPQSHPVMKELLDVMNENLNLKIEIQGHICCDSADKGEIALKRAKAIYRFLQLNGIQAGRLSYRSFRGTKPIHPLPEKSEQERINNRRVEIEIIEQ